MGNETNESIANSLEANEKLLPYMPYLLQDLWALGSSIDKIILAISELQLSNSNIKVLDLGCGKGAVSIKVASKFGFNVDGIDAMKKFLKDARCKAREYGVSHFCNFIEDDIIDYTKMEHDYDIVILASLGGIFGSNSQTIEILRNQIKSGGFILIDDGYLKKGNSINRKGYEYYRNYETTLAELSVFNDQLISQISTTDISREINNEYLELIGNRIKELSIKNPQLEKDLHNYLDVQKEECEILDIEIEGMLWVLKIKLIQYPHLYYY